MGFLIRLRHKNFFDKQSIFKEFLKNRRGSTIQSYVLLVSVMCSAIISTFRPLANTIGLYLCTMAAQIGNTPYSFNFTTGCQAVAVTSGTTPHGCAYSNLGGPTINGCTSIANGSSWTPPTGVSTLHVLVVGGGGGGTGATFNTGGGSGYVAANAAVPASGAPFNITVGAGGAGGVLLGGGSGGTSSFGTITAAGGGTGSLITGGNGGSGGAADAGSCAVGGINGGNGGVSCTYGTAGIGQGSSFASDLLGFTDATIAAGGGGASGGIIIGYGGGGGGGVLINSTGNSGSTSGGLFSGGGGAGYGGGGGGNFTAFPGGAGGAGIVYIEW